MSVFRNIQNNFSALLKLRKDIEMPAFMGDLSGVVKADNNGMVYVTLFSGEVLTVRNQRVANVAHLPIIIGYSKEDTKNLQVLRSRDVFIGNKFPDVPSHAKSHQYPNSDVIYIRGEQYLPGLVIPYTDLTVFLYGYVDYLNSTWFMLPSQVIDLTASLPTSGARWVLVETDETASLSLNDGSTVDNRETLEYSDIPLVTSGKLPVIIVRMYAGQTSIEQTDILDPRTANISGGGSAPFDLAAAIHAATSKNPPVDADEIGIWDSVANALKKLTWANLRATLKTYFDTLYIASTRTISTTAPLAGGGDLSANRTLSIDLSTATAKATPVDADLIANGDSAASFATKKTTFLQAWSNYFKGKADALYAVLAHGHTGSDGTSKLAQANTHESPDTDAATSSLHHTIGTGATQAAAGNHTHSSSGIPADGWQSISGTFTYASSTTINVSSGAASIYTVGDKIRFKNNGAGAYLYAYIITIADTLLTVAGDAVPNATLTSPYYSNVQTPVGFPDWFTYTPTLAVSGGTAPSYTLYFINKFKMDGRKVTVKFHWRNTSGGTAGNGANVITVTLPITGAFSDVGNESIGAGYTFESGGTSGIVNIACYSTTQYWMYSATAAIAGNDQSSTSRYASGLIVYEM